MKTKVEVPITTRKLEEMEVEFPIYRKVETKGLLMRVDMMGATMRECSIKFGKNGTIQLKVNSEYVFEDLDVDYLLGQEEFASNQDEFEQAVQGVLETAVLMSTKDITIS